MSDDVLRIHLSLVSHTNIGKTTLARTLLARDIGQIADRAHVTETTDDYVLARTPEGAELVLWDTPGFGNSVALAKRLAERNNPIGWFLAEVWDRVTNKSQWLNQKALKHVKETSNVVLYLVNAGERPDTAPYVEAEMRILQWIEKPVIVLLNQTGKPQPPEIEQAELDTWKSLMRDYPIVQSVLPMDAFARCWVQEFTLFDAIEACLPEPLHITYETLRELWSRQRRNAYRESLEAMAHYITTLTKDQETAPSGSLMDQMRSMAKRFGIGKNSSVIDAVDAAQAALSARATDAFCALTDELIKANGLKGQGVRQEILEHMASNWDVKAAVPPKTAGTIGAVGTGALGGLGADLASGGLSMGLGALIGSLVGALGGVGIATAYNHIKGQNGTTITWSTRALRQHFEEAVLLYLAISHFGRGRGNWQDTDRPVFWRDTVATVMKENLPERDVVAPGAFDRIVRTTLIKLYPNAQF